MMPFKYKTIYCELIIQKVHFINLIGMCKKYFKQLRCFCIIYKFKSIISSKIHFTFFLSTIFIITKNYGQTTLDYYINAAKQNSPLINENKNLNKVNQFEIEKLIALYSKPQLGITANYLFAPIVATSNGKNTLQLNSQGADKYFGYDLGATNGGQYQALLNVSQPLNNGQRITTLSEQYNIATQVNENNIKLTAHDLEKIITDQYLLCLQDMKQFQYATETISLLDNQKILLKKLVESSIYKQSDLILLNIEYQNFLGQLASYKSNYRRDLFDLNILSAIDDTALVILSEPTISLSTEAQLSGFVEKYRLDSLNAINQQKIFELKYKPQLLAFANTGLNATYAGTLPSRFGLGGGLSLVYNLFDGNQKNTNKKKTAVLLQSLSAYKEKFETQNKIRKSKFLQEINSYSERIAIIQEQLKDYKTLLDTYRKEIITGEISITNYLITIKNMAIVQRDITLLLSQKLSLINTYNYWNW